MKHLYLSLLLVFVLGRCFGQSSLNENYLPWSASRKLTANDFVIKTGNLKTTSSFAQFSMNYEINGFDFLTKNFNKKVHNYFIKSASWIDTTYDVNSSIRYQQTLFDLCEIYSRKLRKELKENRKKVLTGTEFAKELNAKAVTSFSNRRIEYDTDTNFGTDTVKQGKWEMQIAKELTALKDFTRE